MTAYLPRVISQFKIVSVAKLIPLGLWYLLLVLFFVIVTKQGKVFLNNRKSRD